MNRRHRMLAGLLLAVGIGLGLGGPVAAQERELPTGAGRVVEKVQFRVLVETIQLQTHVDRILENNAGVIPGK